MSSYGQPTFISRVASGALSPYRIVSGTASDGIMSQATGPRSRLTGVIGQLGASGGARVDVAHTGLVDVEYGGDVVFGDALTSDSVGRAVLAGPGDNVIGFAFENATADTIGTMLIAPKQGQAGLEAAALLDADGNALAFAAGALAIPAASLEHDRVYALPATAANSTVTLPAGAPNGLRVQFTADGTANGHTVTYADATGPTSITAALTASKRHLVTAVKNGGKWFATTGVSP